MLKIIILRHRKENLNKCSLKGLEKRDNFQFFTYPLLKPFGVQEALFITLDEKAPLLSLQDQNRPLLFLDATWKLALKMERNISELSTLERRSLPSHFKTAYPRKQTDCPDPAKGLSTIEAIAIAYHQLGKKIDFLDDYYWKESFLHLNSL